MCTAFQNSISYSYLWNLTIKSFHKILYFFTVVCSNLKMVVCFFSHLPPALLCPFSLLVFQLFILLSSKPAVTLVHSPSIEGFNQQPLSFKPLNENIILLLPIPLLYIHEQSIFSWWQRTVASFLPNSTGISSLKLRFVIMTLSLYRAGLRSHTNEQRIWA